MSPGDDKEIEKGRTFVSALSIHGLSYTSHHALYLAETQANTTLNFLSGVPNHDNTYQSPTKTKQSGCSTASLRLSIGPQTSRSP
jgi:hypothetical protein